MSLFVICAQIFKFLVSPTNHLIALIFVWPLYFVFGRGGRRSFIILSLYGIFLISPAGRILLYLWEHRIEPPLPAIQKEAVVVLGGRTVLEDKERDLLMYFPNTARIMEAIRLYRRGIVKKILFTGGHIYPVPQAIGPESQTVRKLCLEMGVASQDIHVFGKSLNTWQNFEEIKPVLKDLGIEDFYLITSAFHMPRASALAARFGLTGTPYPVGHKYPHLDYRLFKFGLGSTMNLQDFMWEAIGTLVYKVRGLYDDCEVYN